MSGPTGRVRLVPAGALPRAALDAAGWGWLAEAGALGAYHAADLVAVTEAEADACYLAADALYGLLVDAAGAAIAAGRLRELGVPGALHTLAEYTWEDDRHWHVWGRFDLAGGIAGATPQLIEFNADTATSLPELAVVQWAQALAAGYAEAQQANTLEARLAEQFGRLRAANADLGANLLCTGYPDAPEDDATLAVLGHAASRAGYRVTHASIDTVTFAPGEGVFTQDPSGAWTRHDTVVKLIPWEAFAEDEPAVLADLARLVLERDVVVVNPAYAVVLQSKRLLADVWAQRAGHPNLLEASLAPLAGAHVEKGAYGREGANITVRDRMGRVVEATEGPYGASPRVYQRWAELPRDLQERRYQTGVAWAFEACALGFRRGGRVMTDASPFVGHLLTG